MAQSALGQMIFYTFVHNRVSNVNTFSRNYMKLYFIVGGARTPPLYYKALNQLGSSFHNFLIFCFGVNDQFLFLRSRLYRYRNFSGHLEDFYRF